MSVSIGVICTLRLQFQLEVVTMLTSMILKEAIIPDKQKHISEKPGHNLSWTGHASHFCWAKWTNLTRAPHACFERWPSWVWNICAPFYFNGDGLIFSRTLRGLPSCPWGSQLLHRYTHQPHIRDVASVVRSMYWQFGHEDKNRTSTILTYSKCIPVNGLFLLTLSWWTSVVDWIWGSTNTLAIIYKFLFLVLLNE